jgi:hypothetical protein
MTRVASLKAFVNTNHRDMENLLPTKIVRHVEQAADHYIRMLELRRPDDVRLVFVVLQSRFAGKYNKPVVEMCDSLTSNRGKHKVALRRDSLQHASFIRE